MNKERTLDDYIYMANDGVMLIGGSIFITYMAIAFLNIFIFHWVT